MKEKLRIVLDSNVLISALLGGFCQAVLDFLSRQSFILITTPAILEEIEIVLARKDIVDLSPAQIDRFLKFICLFANLIKPSTTLDICRDKKDNRILEAAVDGKADFIVSGDKDLLSLSSVQGIPIITVREFIKRLSS